MAHLACPRDRGRELLGILIAIAKHEVRRPRGKQLDDGDRTDVAAMQHGTNFETFEHPYRRPREFHVPVRIADDAESQSFSPLSPPVGSRHAQTLLAESNDVIARSGRLISELYRSWMDQ